MNRRTAERLALLGTLTAVFGELHAVMDHWVQRPGDAALKGLHGDRKVWRDGVPVGEEAGDRTGQPACTAGQAGRRAAARHVASYTAGQGRAGKAGRERAAARRWPAEFGTVLPWLPAIISRYEAQDCPEARRVRAADKICPKLLHLLSGACDLAGYGITPGEMDGVLTRQRAGIAGYAAEFTGLLALYDEAAARTLRALAAAGAGRG